MMVERGKTGGSHDFMLRLCRGVLFVDLKCSVGGCGSVRKVQQCPRTGRRFSGMAGVRRLPGSPMPKIDITHEATHAVHCPRSTHEIEAGFCKL